MKFFQKIRNSFLFFSLMMAVSAFSMEIKFEKRKPDDPSKIKSDTQETKSLEDLINEFMSPSSNGTKKTAIKCEVNMIKISEERCIIDTNIDGVHFYIIYKDYDSGIIPQEFDFAGKNLIILGNLKSKTYIGFKAANIFFIGNVEKLFYFQGRGVYAMPNSKGVLSVEGAKKVESPYTGGKDEFIQIIQKAIQKEDWHLLIEAILKLILKVNNGTLVSFTSPQ